MDMNLDKDKIIAGLLSGLDDLEKTTKKKYKEIGEEIGMALGEGFQDGINDSKKQIKQAEKDLYTEFMLVKKRIQSRKTNMKLDDIKVNLDLTQALMDSQQFSNTIKNVFKDISASFNGVEVRGLENVLNKFREARDELDAIDWGFGLAHDAKNGADVSSRIKKVTQQREKINKQTAVAMGDITDEVIGNTSNVNDNTVAVNNNMDAKKDAIKVNKELAESEKKVADTQKNTSFELAKVQSKIADENKRWEEENARYERQEAWEKRELQQIKDNYSKHVFRDNKPTYDSDKIRNAENVLKDFNAELSKRNEFEEKYQSLRKVISDSYVGKYGINQAFWGSIEDVEQALPEFKQLTSLMNNGIKGVSTKEINQLFKSVVNRLNSDLRTVRTDIEFNKTAHKDRVFATIEEEERSLGKLQQQWADKREAHAARMSELNKEELELIRQQGQAEEKRRKETEATIKAQEENNDKLVQAVDEYNRMMEAIVGKNAGRKATVKNSTIEDLIKDAVDVRGAIYDKPGFWKSNTDKEHINTLNNFIESYKQYTQEYIEMSSHATYGARIKGKGSVGTVWYDTKESADKAAESMRALGYEIEVVEDNLAKLDKYERDLFKDLYYQDESYKNERQANLTNRLGEMAYDSTSDNEWLLATLEHRREILRIMEQEGFMTDDLRQTHEAINTQFVERINLNKEYNKAVKDADEIRGLTDNANHYNLDELVELLAKRKEVMSSFSQEVLDEDMFNLDIGFDELEEENKRLERRIELLKQVKQGLIDIDDVDDIIAESGSLDDKLSHLQSFAELLNLTKKGKEDYDDDVAQDLEDFEKVYDRIILKFKNGKPKEILADETGLNGLRNFLESAEKEGLGNYLVGNNIKEIEDIVFVRKQELAVVEKTNDALEEQEKIEKRRQNQANKDNVIYHSGVISRLNKAETNGQFAGSNRGTGYYGTGHYFVDGAHKSEIMSAPYGQKPFTSVDISYYDNLFKADTTEKADQLHSFLTQLTKYTQGAFSGDASELFDKFKQVFGETVLDFDTFADKLEELTVFMSKSDLYDRSDSVATQFMKSLGYGGVDTRGTKNADTSYGIVIYDLKEASILQANITDEIQKQGDMLEKIDYAPGEVWDAKEDARIQALINEREERQRLNQEIETEYKGLYDESKLQQYTRAIEAKQAELDRLNRTIEYYREGINNPDIIARQYREAEEMAMDFDPDYLMMDESLISELTQDRLKEYKEELPELITQQAALTKEIEETSEALRQEEETSKRMFDQAVANVEARRNGVHVAPDNQVALGLDNEPLGAYNDFIRDLVEYINKTPMDTNLGPIFEKYQKVFGETTMDIQQFSTFMEDFWSSMSFFDGNKTEDIVATDFIKQLENSQKAALNKNLLGDANLDKFFNDWKIDIEQRDAIMQEVYKLASIVESVEGDTDDERVVSQLDKVIGALQGTTGVKEKTESIYSEFLEHIQNSIIAYDPADYGLASEFGDDWGKVRQKYAKLLASSESERGRNKNSIDQAYAELVELFPQFFPDDVYSEADQLRRILDIVDKARQEAKKPKYQVTDEVLDALAGDFKDNIFGKIIAGPQIDTSSMEEAAESAEKTAKATEKETKAFDGVTPAAKKAGKAKGEFTKANKGVAGSIPGSVDGIGEETEGFEKLAEVSDRAADQVGAALNRIKSNNKYPANAISIGGVEYDNFQSFADQMAEAQGMSAGPVNVEVSNNGEAQYATVKLMNKELAQSVLYRYEMIKAEDGVTKAFLKSYHVAGDGLKALENQLAAEKKKAAEDKKAAREALSNKEWLIKQQAKLDGQEIKYQNSNKSIDGNTKVLSGETSLGHDAEVTINTLTQHIKDRIKAAMSDGLTNEVRTSILNDLRILQREITVAQNNKYSATKMKAATVETNRDAYKEYLRGFKANAKKSNIFEAMKDDIDALNKKLLEVDSAESMNDFVDMLKIAQNKFQAEKAQVAQLAAEEKQRVEALKQQERAYDDAIKKQDQLYKAKQKLAVEDDPAKSKILSREVDELQEKYDISLRLLHTEEDYYKLKDREEQQEDELNAVKQKAAEAEIARQEKLNKEQQDLVKSQTDSYFKEQEKAYERSIQLQDQLYNLKKKMIDVESGSAEAQELSRKINAKQDEYEASLKLIHATEDLVALEEQEIKLQDEVKLFKQEKQNSKDAKNKSFALDIDRQFGLLTKQQAQWEKNGQLTDELRQKIEGMFNALTEVTDSVGLSNWKKQWMILKDEVAQTKYEIEAANSAQKEANAVTQAERKASGTYWDGRFKDSIEALSPQKRPELEQLKTYMKQQADVMEQDVVDQYDAIMTIVAKKNNALKRLMSAKGPEEQQYWQDEYSAWFGAWNSLDQDLIGDFFTNVGNQAILGADKIEKFNEALETSKLLSAQASDKLTNTKQKEDDKIARVNQSYGKTQYNREFKYLENLSAKINSMQLGDDVSDLLSNKMKQYSDVMIRLKDMRDIFETNPSAADNVSLRGQFQSAALEAEKLRKEIVEIYKEGEKLSQIPVDNIFGTYSFKDNNANSSDIAKRKQAMIELAETTMQGQFRLEGFNATYTEMYGVIDKGNGIIQEVTVSLNRSNDALVAYQSGTRQVTNTWQQLGKTLKDTGMQFARMCLSFHDIIRVVRQGITRVRDIDLALTELKKVTDETDSSYKQFLKDMANTASAVGSTVQDLTNSAAGWARVGYSMQQAGELAKSTAVLMNVSEFDSAESATEALTSILQAFNYTATDSIQIVDKLNIVGNNFAISSYGAAEGLKRSAATLVAAGNSLEESLAMLAAGNRVMQDPEAMGNALKVLSMRIRGVKTELEEAGESTDGMITNTSKLQAKIEALTNIDGSGGIDILTDDGGFKSTYQILLGISEVWEKMDNMSQAALLEIIAGKVRGSQVAAILQNPEDLKDAYEKAFDSAGSAMEENEKFLDSIQGRVQLFTTALETFWQNTISSDAIKWVVDRGTDLLEILNKVHGSVLAVGAALIGLKVKGMGPVSLFKDSGKTIQNYIQAVSKLSALKSLGVNIGTGNTFDTAAVTAYANAVDGLTVKKQAELLMTTGLNKAQVIEVLTRNNVDAAVARETVSKMGLLNTTRTLQAATVAETLSKVQAKDATQQKAIADFIAAHGSEKLTAELLEQMVAQTGVNATQLAGVATANKLAFSWTALGKSIQMAWASLSAFGKFSLIIAAVGTLFTIGKSVYNHFHKSTEDLVEDWDNIKSEISSINDELKTTQDRIKALERQGALSFTDKKELELLRQQNDELARRLRLKEQASIDAGTEVQKAVKKDYQSDFIKHAIITDEDIDRYNQAYNITQGIATLYNNTDVLAFGGLTSDQQNLIKSLVPEDVYNELSSKTWSGLSDGARAVVNEIYNEYQRELQDLDFISNQYGPYVSGEVYIDQAIQKIKEYKNAIYDANGQLKEGLDDEYIVEISTNIHGLEQDLANVANELYDYMDQYGGDASDEFVQLLQSQIDKIDLSINPVDFYKRQFDAIFKEFNKEKVALYKLAEQGELTAASLNSTTYAPLMQEMYALGITAQELADHINAFNTLELNAVTNPDFNIADYADAIDAMQENISEYQSALESLEAGTFTYSDFIDLTQKFPELAKGVDKSSKSFSGLAKNLKKAIKASPDDLIDDLKFLREQLKATGKSTSDIDLLIESIENLPDEAVKDLAKDYSTLADEINAAKKAHNDLQQAMSENPNEGYETRGEAYETMREMFSRGEIGSESAVWSIAKESGFIYDNTKSLYENADALAEWLDIRERWYTQDDDGNYTFHGVQNFIKDVEKAVESSAELQEILQWDYDSANGIFSFDYDNKNLPKIIDILHEKLGLTTSEWMDYQTQIGQYFELSWGDIDDQIDAFIQTRQQKYADMYNQIINGNFDYTKAAHISAEEMQKYYPDFDGSMATTFDQGHVIADYNGTDYSIVISCITPDGTEILNQQDLDDYIYGYLAGSDNILEADKIENGGKGILINIAEGAWDESQFEQFNAKIAAIKDREAEFYKLLTTGQADGPLTISTQEISDYFEVTGSELDNLIEMLKTKYGEFLTITEDPLSINTQGDLETDIIMPLRKAGLEIERIFTETGEQEFQLNIVDFETLLRNNGYTTENIMDIANRIFGEGSSQSNLVEARERIQNINFVSQETKDTLEKLGIAYNFVASSRGAYLTITSNVDEVLAQYQFTDQEIEAFKTKWESNGIYVHTTVDSTEVDETKASVENIPDGKETTYTVTGTGETAVENINKQWQNVPTSKSTDYTINETTNKHTNYTFSFGGGDTKVNGTAHVQGTAYKTGTWGAQKSETALTGELGPELRVRGNRWDLLGENGAEFADIQKGDIIFNHAQTEQLLAKGYVTGRGKAYASGTAYASGGGKFTFYKFNGDDSYTKHGVNELPSVTSNTEKAADAANDFKEAFDWVEIRLEEINEQLDLLGAKLENAVGYKAKNSIIDQMLGVNSSKLKNLQGGLETYTNYAAKLLGQIPAQYREAAQDGSIAITEFAGDAGEQTVEAINNYREWAEKVADLTQQIEELGSEIADLAQQKFDNVADQFDNQISLIESANDKLDAQVSLMEDRGYVASKAYYESMAENTKEISAQLVKERDELQAVLDEQVRLGNVKVGSDTWYEMVQQLYDVDASIVECTSDLESFQNAINDIYWDNFDELLSRYDYLSDETQNLIDLMDDADMVSKPDNEDGWASSEVTWTEEGIASIGLYAQQMEIAEYKTKQYTKAIDDLNKDYADGKYSESEYLEKLNDLRNGQYDSIEAYKDAKDAIKDLNSEMVDAAKDGLEKQIDAYGKLAEKRKEALDAEKDAVDFQKSIAKQQKNLADIDRQLAALSGNSSISAAAKRRQLEAERAELQAELDEMYYDRSIENQKEAIDKELEIFTESREKEIEQWDKYLEDVEKVVADSLMLVQTNASTVYDTLNDKANEYGLNVSEAVTSPWTAGENAISNYTKVFGDAVSSTTDQLSKMTLAWQEVIDKMTEAAEVEIEAQQKANNRYVAATSASTSTTSQPSSSTSSSSSTSTKSAPSVGQTVTVKKSATHFSAQSGNAKMASFVPGGSYQVMQVGVNGDKSQILIGKNGVATGWVKLTDLNGYAKGTIGVDDDQFAWLDELGEELVMHADGNGRLSFLTKGTSVIPADLTKNLMQLGQLNPQDILDRSRPVVSAPHITNNNIELTMEIGEVVHIDTVTNETVPNLTKAIDKQLDKYMKQLNGQIRR